MTRDAGTSRAAPLPETSGSAASHLPLSRLATALHLEAGDDRLALDPRTGRNRYGVPPHAADDEIWLSSCTATAIPAATYAALERRCAGKLDGDRASWTNDIRTRLAGCFGIDAAQVRLTPSGTDAERMVARLAARLIGPAVVDVIADPSETGSGVAAAARSAGDVDVQVIALRDRAGRARTEAKVFADTRAIAAQACARDAGLLLHLMHASKTGLSLLSAEWVADVAAIAPARTLVVVDACQLRCKPAEVSAWLDRGYLVQITGSKFAGAPPFCGALLLPRSHVTAAIPAADAAEPGLLLRWEAALHHMEALAALPADDIEALTRAVNDLIAARLAACPLLTVVPSAAPATSPRIFTVLTAAGTPAQAHAIYKALRTPGPLGTDGRRDWRACHTGQPVSLADRAALRLCAGMPLLLALHERWRTTGNLEQSLAPLARNLDYLLAKWVAAAAL